MSTKIAWTDESWNPVVGCTKVSAGCKNCYAERMARRQAYMGNLKYQCVVEYEEDERDGENVVNAPKITFHDWNGETYCDEAALDKPLHWKKPRMIFVCSMGDLFHESVPFEFIDRVHAAMIMAIRKGYYHTYQILTKRPKRMLKYYSSNRRPQLYKILERDYEELTGFYGINWPFPCLWLGITAENQEMWEKRKKAFFATPAAVHFVSNEPLLSAIEYSKEDLEKLDWVIIGCESGPGAGECKIEWVRDLAQQGKAAGVPVFVKQLQMVRARNDKIIRYKTDKIEEFPKDLRIQEYPKE